MLRAGPRPRTFRNESRFGLTGFGGYADLFLLSRSGWGKPLFGAGLAGRGSDRMSGRALVVFPTAPFLHGCARLAKSAIGNGSRSIPLKPSMAVSAEIKIGRRRVIPYRLSLIGEAVGPRVPLSKLAMFLVLATAQVAVAGCSGVRKEPNGASGPAPQLSGARGTPELNGAFGPHQGQSTATEVSVSQAEALARALSFLPPSSYDTRCQGPRAIKPKENIKDYKGFLIKNGLDLIDMDCLAGSGAYINVDSTMEEDEYLANLVLIIKELLSRLESLNADEVLKIAGVSHQKITANMLYSAATVFLNAGKNECASQLAVASYEMGSTDAIRLIRNLTFHRNSDPDASFCRSDTADLILKKAKGRKA